MPCKQQEPRPKDRFGQTLPDNLNRDRILVLVLKKDDSTPVPDNLSWVEKTMKSPEVAPLFFHGEDESRGETRSKTRSAFHGRKAGFESSGEGKKSGLDDSFRDWLGSSPLCVGAPRTHQERKCTQPSDHAFSRGVRGIEPTPDEGRNRNGSSPKSPHPSESRGCS